MNVTMSTSAALAQYSDDAVGMTVLKKAVNIEAQAAVELINAVPPSPQTAAANLPPHLGQNINTTA
jgi:hypothetical protein